MQGKPYAGNPHVRFDEGAGAPRHSGRSALLYNRKNVNCIAVAACLCASLAVQGASPGPVASITPLKDAKRTEKARALNAAAADVVKRLGGIATDDLFALLDPLDREQNWSDTYHHKPPVRQKEAEQVAASVMAR